jgi:hypothetical protein
VKRSVADAFIHGFRMVMLLCAALAAAGAAVGWASLRGQEMASQKIAARPARADADG